ncbi:CcdB family protein [Sphingomonas bacterium]|uniref:CcdB family protein n=1 Tax=Sphingomonas bacterium TaxID=1895847 RepID=UPI0015764D38|nr:CcdB family protein [Sphingomonas bacterium]
MPQFDVYRTREGDLLLDCQSDALSHLTTRLTAPLLPASQSPDRRARLNPEFAIDGETYIMVTQFAAAVSARVLGTKITNLAIHRFEIIGAFDMMLTGV